MRQSLRLSGGDFSIFFTRLRVRHASDHGGIRSGCRIFSLRKQQGQCLKKERNPQSERGFRNVPETPEFRFSPE